MTERVIAIVAHPDDESLGPGATLAKHAAAGDLVSVFVLADGVGSRRTGTGLNIGGISEAIKERHGMCRRACKILGTEDVWFYQFPDNAMDTVPLLQVVQQIERHVKRFEPTVVYTHWRGDLNMDHQIVHAAVNVACRPETWHTVRKLFYFEIPCSTAWGTGFEPNCFADVEHTFQQKLDACMCYESELRPYPHPRSIDGIKDLARIRGSRVGIHAAEAFVASRVVW